MATAREKSRWELNLARGRPFGDDEWTLRTVRSEGGAHDRKGVKMSDALAALSKEQISKSPEATKARAAAVILRGDRLLVIRRHKQGQDYYVLPGGGIEPGETAEQACVREAREETSLVVSVRKLLKAFGNQGRQEYYFLVDAQRGTPQLGGPEQARQSASNQYEIQWIGYRQLREINLMPPAMRGVCRSLLRGGM